jgi:hypothetical protein
MAGRAYQFLRNSRSTPAVAKAPITSLDQKADITGWPPRNRRYVRPIRLRAHFTICPKRAGSLRPRGPTMAELASQAWTPARAANAVRLALRRQTHSEPDENTFHQMLQAAVGLKAKDHAPYVKR